MDHCECCGAPLAPRLERIESAGGFVTDWQVDPPVFDPEAAVTAFVAEHPADLVKLLQPLGWRVFRPLEGRPR